MAERVDLTEAPLPRAPRAKRPQKRGRGTGVAKLDEIAVKVLGGAAIIAGLMLLYLLWGLLSGPWSHEVVGQMRSAQKLLQLANIALVFQILDAASFLLIVSLLVSDLY